MNLIGRHVGNYEVRLKLGEGGMGEVYLCEHTELGRKAVIKVLHEELSVQDDIVERFFHEAKAANEIGHPNIVDVYDFGHLPGASGDLVYILMEFLDGASLGSRLKHEGLSDHDVLHIIAQCCDALSASHAKGIIHRDLKPENLYLVPRGADRNFVKILDFGIAKLVGEQHRDAHQTRAGVALGTPSYMSPEQCAATGGIDARSDIYSLGVVMYELLTRRLPFEQQTQTEIMLGHMTATPLPPSAHRPELAPELEAIVLHAMEKDRVNRFQSMEEMGAAVADPARHLTDYHAQLALRAAEIKHGVHTGHTLHDSGAIAPPGPPPPITDRPTMHFEGGLATGPTVAAETPTHLTPAHVTPTHVTPTHVTPTHATPPRGGTAVIGGSGAAEPLAAELAASVHTRRILTVVASLSGVVALASLVGMLVVTLRGPRAPRSAPAVATTTAPSRPSAPPLPAPAPPPKVTMLSVNVRSEPPGARVDWAERGVVAGTTPLTLAVGRGEPPIMLRVSLDGYVPVMQRVDTERDSDVTITLKRVAATEPPPPPPPAAPKRAGDGKRPIRKKDKDKPTGDILLKPMF